VEFDTESQCRGTLSEQSFIAYSNQVRIPMIPRRRQHQIGSDSRRFPRSHYQFWNVV
jgi:hypothetical protein